MSLDKRVAIYLSDPVAAPVGKEVWAAVDRSELRERLRRNKVPLLSARALRSEAPIWDTEPFASALREEQASLDGQRAEFAPVHQALRDAGIPDALIKSAGIEPSFPYRNDNVDLLVPLEHGERAARILYDLGYVELRNIEEPRKFLFKRFLGGEEVSAIHLHEQVGWGTGFLVEGWLWERVRPSQDDPLVTLLGPEDAALVTLAHALYEDKEFKIWDMVKVRHCLRAGEFDWDYCARHAEQRGWLHGLNAILHHASRIEQRWFESPVLPPRVPGHGEAWAGWEAKYAARLTDAPEHLPSPVPFVYSKRHYFTKVARDRALTRAQKWDDAARHALAGVRRNLRLFSQRRMLIAVSGVDGSGKTTHAEAIRAAFARCDIRARVVWSRGASSPLTDAAIRLGKRVLRKRAESAQGAEAQISRRAGLWQRPLIRRLWPWVLALDLWRQYMVSIGWPLLRGSVVIADRYVADAQAEVATYLDRAGHPGLPLALRLLGWLSPRPALQFLLDVPAEEAARRAASAESAEFLRAQSGHYRQMAEKDGWRVLDASRPRMDVSSEIVRITLLRYFYRYRTTANALFLFNPRAKRPFLEKP